MPFRSVTRPDRRRKLTLSIRMEKLTSGDKNKPIVVYCKTGTRAARAKTILLEAGYTQVTNLGGIDDWYRWEG